MTPDEHDIISKKIISVIKDLATKGSNGVDLAVIGQALGKANIQYKQYGFVKLKPFLNAFTDILKLQDTTVEGKPPVCFVSLKDTGHSAEVFSNNTSCEETKYPTANTKLRQWAIIAKEKIAKLTEKALPEDWYYGQNIPNTSDPYPILEKYLKYTFKKLVLEDKVLIGKNENDNNEYAAFNTGLVDVTYEDIYALFKKNTKYDDYYWYLVDFVVAGGDAGKTLVSTFNPLPQKADYFNKKIENMFYDASSGDLSCDYEHILTERTERFPLQLFLNECTSTFTCIKGNNIEDMYKCDVNEQVKKEYFSLLGEKIKSDNKMLNRLKYRLDNAVKLALKRVQWNYKTAIPMYFPTKDTMSLLLPLALVDDHIVDLALVVERQPSGAYQGETVLPLDWAYSNSRLVTRPDSDWLRTDIINHPTMALDE